MRRTLAALLWTVLPFGCIYSAKVTSETLPRAPAAFENAEDSQKKKEAPAIGRWWQVFKDRKLDALMKQALEANLTIEQAWVRLSQARASLKLSRAGYWPRLSARGEAGRSHTAMKFGERQSASFDRDTLAVSLAASYEIDLWGKVRFAAKAARLELEASEDDVRAAYLSVAAQLVESYFIAAELRAQLELLQQTVDNRRRHVELVERRYREGVVTALDLYQAKQNLAAARAQQHTFRRQLASTEHALCVLMGRAPARGKTGTLDELPQQVVELPPGLPAQLLLRRPDLAAAQRRLMAADAQVGQAVAGHYPSLTLSASLGYQFDPASLVWSILGGLLVPIFEGQRVSAEVDLRKAQLRQALVSYRASLLQALVEVEDALTSGKELEARVKLLEERVTAAEGALRMSTDQYTQGLVSFLQVLTAEQGVYTAKRELITARRELVSTRVQLARALGGGWMQEEFDRNKLRRRSRRAASGRGGVGGGKAGRGVAPPAEAPNNKKSPGAEC
jgi:NodT family efflux transporter outer membrane factor (OMF) lipoprotein